MTRRRHAPESGSPRAIKVALAAALFLCPLSSVNRAFAQQAGAEPVAIAEVGAAPGRNIKDGTSALGPTLAVEVTPVENWLELEAGITSSFGRHSTEWATDLLFKKPWTLSKTVEFMAGIGPEWIHTRELGITTNSPGGEAVLDFMFWPGGKHKLGWYLEPGYEYNFGRGHEQSIGVAVGLLIAIHKH